MNIDDLNHLLNAHNKKSTLSSNVKLAVNVIGLLSAAIYGWIEMENRITALEGKILAMEEMDKLETQIRMLESRGKEWDLERIKRRIAK